MNRDVGTEPSIVTAKQEGRAVRGQASADVLRQRLRHDGEARHLLAQDPAYKFQVEVVCQLLDVVDQCADAGTAARVVEEIYSRLVQRHSEVEALKRYAHAGLPWRRFDGP